LAASPWQQPACWVCSWHLPWPTQQQKQSSTSSCGVPHVAAVSWRCADMLTCYVPPAAPQSPLAAPLQRSHRWTLSGEAPVPSPLPPSGLSHPPAVLVGPCPLLPVLRSRGRNQACRAAPALLGVHGPPSLSPVLTSHYVLGTARRSTVTPIPCHHTYPLMPAYCMCSPNITTLPIQHCAQPASHQTTRTHPPPPGP
jgi:hypothetical protein